MDLSWWSMLTDIQHATVLKLDTFTLFHTYLDICRNTHTFPARR